MLKLKQGDEHRRQLSMLTPGHVLVLQEIPKEVTVMARLKISKTVCTTASMKILANYFKGGDVDSEFLTQATEHLTACEVCLKEYTQLDRLLAGTFSNLIAYKENLSCKEYAMLLLPAYCDKNLEGMVMDRVEQHLRNCERCIEEYDKLLSMRIEEDFDKPNLDAVELKAIKDFVSEEEWEQKGKELEESLERYVQERQTRVALQILEFNE
jgi:hypothetical protein